MSTRTYGLRLNVEGFLRNSKYPSEYRGLFTDDRGQTLTPAEARAFLRMQAYKGRVCIPMSDQCGNPCKHAERGCTGFDFKGGGCPGRESDADHTPSTIAQR